MPSKEEARSAAMASPVGEVARVATSALLEGVSAVATAIVNRMQLAVAEKQNAVSNSDNRQLDGQPGTKGMNNPSTQKAVNTGNRVHYDKQNGASGDTLPTELMNRYPETDFEFTRRGQKGPDVQVVGGELPWDQNVYPNSPWAVDNFYGDFKPDTLSGQRTFNSDIQSGKLPSNTQYLPYDPRTGHLIQFEFE